MFGLCTADTGKALYAEFITDSIAKERMHLAGFQSEETKDDITTSSDATAAAVVVSAQESPKAAATIVLDDLFRKTKTQPHLYWMEAQ